MKPEIHKTSFGSITVGAIMYDHDIVIRLDGRIEKRKKKLSKAVYGTSHTVSLDEILVVYEKGAECMIVGTGQYGVLKISGEAMKFLDEKGCQVKSVPTPDAIRLWNREGGNAVGLFHVTC